MKLVRRVVILGLLVAAVAYYREQQIRAHETAFAMSSAPIPDIG